MSDGAVGVVLDAGTLDSKAGFAGESFPRYVAPTLVGRFRKRGLFDGFPDIYFGKEAVRYRGVSNLTWPVKDGFIDDWDEMEKFWHHIFYKGLHVAPEQAQVLHAVHPLTPRKHKEQMAEIFFESFMIQDLYIAISSALCLHASGRTSGVMWENGYSCCYASPVFEGFPLKHATVSSNLSGRTLSDHLNTLMETIGYSFTTPTDKEILDKIKYIRIHNTHQMRVRGYIMTLRNSLKHTFYQRDIDSVFEWSKLNKLMFNVDKCSILSFSLRHNIISFDYNLGNSRLSRQSSVKDLGVLMKADLSFSNHITSNCNKAYRALGFVLRQSQHLGISTTKMLYNSFVRSILENNAFIWSPHEAKYKLMLEKLQNKFARRLYLQQYGYFVGYPYLYPSLFLLGMLGYNTLEHRRSIALLEYFYQLIRGRVHNPSVLELVALNVPEKYIRARRHDLFAVPMCRLHFVRESPLVRALTMLNGVVASDSEAKLCYVSKDYDEEISSFPSAGEGRVRFDLPDGQFVLLGKERFMCPEILFQPSLLGSSQPSIVEDICSSINKCDMDYKAMFFENIVISGGSSMFPGLPERLSVELSKRVADLPGVTAKVDAMPTRNVAPWAGGSILASLSTMKGFWMTREEYEDVGRDGVNHKFY